MGSHGSGGGFTKPHPVAQAQWGEGFRQAIGEIDAIYENAMDKGWRFYCLTSSGEKGIENWRDITGARYDFLSADATVLKTMIRSNPGLILLKDGTILGKWSHNRLEKVLCN